MSTQNKKVKEVMFRFPNFPIVKEKTILKEALEKMDEFHLGIACVTNENDKLLGVITDGDIRRKLLNIQKPLSAFFVDDVINQAIKNPFTITSNITLARCIAIMEEKQIWDLPVVDNSTLVGLLHLHSVTKALLGD